MTFKPGDRVALPPGSIASTGTLVYRETSDIWAISWDGKRQDRPLWTANVTILARAGLVWTV